MQIDFCKCLSFQTTVTDVLKAMKAVPSGFRSSTLGSLLKQGKDPIYSLVIIFFVTFAE